MFAVLGLSEEREPVAVLKSTSKRAQRRAQRAEARQQENVADKGPKSALDWQNEVALQNASARLYEELFGDAAEIDPSLLEDLAANFRSMGLGQAGLDVVGRGHGHGDRDNKARSAASNGTNGTNGSAAVARPGASGFGAARLGSAPPAVASHSEWHSSLNTHIDVPPGPGPGSGCYGGSGSGNGAWGSGQIPSSLLRSPARQPSLGAGPGLGSWAGPSGGASPFHTGAASRGPSLGPPPPQPQPREEFPQLQAAASSPAGRQAGGAAGWQGAGPGGRRKARGNGSGQFRHGAFGQKGAGGIKVLNAARPLSDGEQSLHRSGSDGSSDLSLQLVWELLDENMVQLEDPLAGCEGGAAAGAGGPGGLGGSAGASDAAVKAVIRRLVEAQCGGEDGGPARGLSQEDMIAMMAKAHRRQQASSRARARARAGAAAGTQGGEEQEGEGSSEAEEEEEEEEEDDSHYYTSREETKTWRRTVEWMERNDWVRVTDTDGKHYKYRRLLPNGRIQTQTVCCSPSDAMRGVRNLQADLARKDAEANEVIRAWRQEQRAKAREAAAAARAARQQEEDG